MTTSSIYDHARAYDVAFSFRDVEKERRFLNRMLAQHGHGGQPRAVLECFAGPARHARAYAAAGIAAVAVDLSEAMCRYAAEYAGDQLPFRAVAADARNLLLSPARFDLVFTLMDSLSCLTSLDDLVAHLSAVRDHLAPGGVYVISCAHPREIYDGDRVAGRDWTCTEDGWTVRTIWCANPEALHDPRTGTVDVLTRMEVTHPDGRRETLEGRSHNRPWTAVEVDAGRRLAGGLEIAEWYGALDERVPFDLSEAAWRMVVILRGGPPRP